MVHWPVDHHWLIFKLNITQYDVWLIDYFGGAAIITPEEYFSYNGLATSPSEGNGMAVNDPV
jgi:hypothetical protein